jgi:NADH-quinone oxidoreductase subunit L
MLSIPLLLILIPALPLAAAVVTAVLGPRVLRQASHSPTVLAVAGSCAASLLLVVAVRENPQQEQIVRLWTWAVVDHVSPLPSGEGTTSADALPGSEATRSFHVDVVLRADPLTAIMLATVTFISLLVAIYSIGYMHGDRGYWRFFSYVSLFVFSMTMLVSVNNFLLLYVFWEAVGLCSYLLIGFWYEKPSAVAAGLKAFLTTRTGDLGFALGVFLLWTTYGTLDFDTIFQRVPDAGPATVTAIALLLLAGACGKSAQFPLHVWLPDAMEGPTPVSALIHAATMVTAGVYMVARCTPLFLASPEARLVVAAIGGVTALMAATIALTQTDLKRILAYSTISQLGYMFLGLGTGTLLGVAAAMFHLVTHAFFKALLFLGAGSVMHATGGVIDVQQLGGLRRRMPTTHWTFLFGCLALAGIFPFAGFWSKDAILGAVAQRAHAGDAAWLYLLLYLAGMLTAFLTAVYAFRAFFLTFYGQERLPREAAQHVHESPGIMTGPLVILALGALLVGACLWASGGFLGRGSFLAQTSSLDALVLAEPADVVQHEPPGATLLASGVALAGIAVAAVLYLGHPAWLAAVTALMNALGLYRLSRDKFYFDALYRAVVVGPLARLAAVLAWLDRHAVDALVDYVGAVPRLLGAMLRPLGGGLVQFYAWLMVVGVLALIGALLW